MWGRGEEYERKKFGLCSLPLKRSTGIFYLRSLSLVEVLSALIRHTEVPGVTLTKIMKDVDHESGTGSPGARKVRRELFQMTIFLLSRDRPFFSTACMFCTLLQLILKTHTSSVLNGCQMTQSDLPFLLVRHSKDVREKAVKVDALSFCGEGSG